MPEIVLLSLCCHTYILIQLFNYFQCFDNHCCPGRCNKNFRGVFTKDWRGKDLYIMFALRRFHATLFFFPAFMCFCKSLISSTFLVQLSASGWVDTVCFIFQFQRQAQNPNGKEIQMLVQRSQVGSVIGRGGYKIKETREVLTQSVTLMNIELSPEIFWPMTGSTVSIECRNKNS